MLIGAFIGLFLVGLGLGFAVGRGQRRPAPAAPSPPPPATLPAAAAPSPLHRASPESALQLLGLLQREARFVDFLEEDVGGFSDAEIGAAARVVHTGAKKALAAHFSIGPVRTEAEGARVTVPAGFDARAVKLTGNVTGSAPFTGTLQHRGWRVTETRLPELAEGHDPGVLAPAEVEL